MSSTSYRILHPKFKPPGSPVTSSRLSSTTSARSSSDVKLSTPTQQKRPLSRAEEARQKLLQHTPLVNPSATIQPLTTNSLYGKNRLLNDAATPSKSSSSQVQSSVNRKSNDVQLKATPDVTGKSPAIAERTDVRAGRPSSLLKEPVHSQKKRNHTDGIVPNDKDVQHSQKPVLKSDAGNTSQKTAPQTSHSSGVKTFGEKKSEEGKILFDRKGRIPEKPSESAALISTTSIRSGGFYPEDARPGLKMKTEVRPPDHRDVIRYEHSGGICPPVKAASALDFNRISSDRKQYENALRSQIASQHDDTAKMYNYYRARTSSSSLAFTDFLYDKK